MKKYFISTLSLLLLLFGTSCKKEVAQSASKKTFKELSIKSEDALPVLKGDFSDKTIKFFNKELDETSFTRLANQIKDNKELSDYLNKNNGAIRSWMFLSSSIYAQDINAIKYFDNLSPETFLLISKNNSAEIFDLPSGALLARVEKDAIVITKFYDNAFANLNNFVPNAIYKVNNFNYSIDDLGRVMSVKTPLLKSNNTIVTNSLGDNLIVSPNWGGSNLKLNTINSDYSDFVELNETWANTLKSRGKISNLSIKYIYSSTENVPDGFNVAYYNGKNRVLSHIKNTYKEEYKTFEKIKLSAKGTHIKGTPAVATFPKEVTLVKNTLFYNNKQFGIIDPKNKVININRRAALNQNNINPFLDHPILLPDYKYVVKDGVNQHIFMTDNLGRVMYSEHRVLTLYAKIRNVVSQNNAKLYGDEISSKITIDGLTNSQHRKLSDEGGHYLAASSGGIPESINITSQAYRVNHSKKWRGMESKILLAQKNGYEVLVKNRQFYDDNSRRPSGYIYEVTINGKTKSYEFDNTNYTLKDI